MTRSLFPCPPSRYRAVVGALVLLACKDNGPCSILPCPLFEAVTVTVSAANGQSVANLAIAVNDASPQASVCDKSVCHVFGGPGQYRLSISAPGFSSGQTSVTVTGTPAGCGTCGQVDRQQIAVVLQPARKNNKADDHDARGAATGPPNER